MTRHPASTLCSLFGAVVMTVAMLAGVDGLASGDAATAPMAAQAVASPAKA